MPRAIVATLLLLWLGGAATHSLAATPGEVGVGEIVRDVTMTGLNGPSRKLSEFRGKPLLINVWASWCGPCRAEMASLERLAWHPEASYFNVIGISTDDYVDRAQKALAQSNATITHFIDKELELENMLGASSIPLTVLIDGEGRVVKKVRGAREWDSPSSILIINSAFREPPKPR